MLHSVFLLSSHACPWAVKKSCLYLHIVEHSIFSTWCCPVSTGISCKFEVQVFPGVCACNKWAGNMLMFRLDVTTKRLMTRLKNKSFHDSESTLTFERQWVSFMKHEQNEFLCKSCVKWFWRKFSDSLKCSYFPNVSWYERNLHLLPATRK